MCTFKADIMEEILTGYQTDGFLSDHRRNSPIDAMKEGDGLLKLVNVDRVVWFWLF